MTDTINYDNIVIFVPDLGFGGAQRVAISIANYLVSNNYVVEIVTLKNGINGLASLIDPRVTIKYCGTRLSRSFYYWIKYFWASKRDRNLIISGIRYANLVLCLSKLLSFVHCKHKIVLREANTYRQFEFSGFRDWLLLRLLTLAYHQADQIVANSKDTKEDIIKYLSINLTRKVCISDNPISFETRQWIESEDISRLKFQLRNRFTIGTVGRFETQKDHRFLIESFAALKTMKTDAALVIVGDGSLLPSYLKVIGEKNLKLNEDVFILRPTIQLPPVIQMFDLFCLTSRWEGFGNVVIEAALCKVPVVVKECPGGASLLVEKYSIGSKYACDDPKEFGSVIGKIPNTNWKSFADLYQNELSPQAWCSKIGI